MLGCLMDGSVEDIAECSGGEIGDFEYDAGIDLGVVVAGDGCGGGIGGCSNGCSGGCEDDSDIDSLCTERRITLRCGDPRLALCELLKAILWVYCQFILALCLAIWIALINVSPISTSSINERTRINLALCLSQEAGKAANETLNYLITSRYGKVKTQILNEELES
ncbi:Hypothetical predicted protein [Octopus vulgaris]|uniref:Uncharacterized protein n=1 Tax=Octopus vulgaris TaxID=6645 RepID=A0AA36B108_OCTVU|nr:Hypothetical predicted protein [Octopus vulgaris]